MIRLTLEGCEAWLSGNGLAGLDSLWQSNIRDSFVIPERASARTILARTLAGYLARSDGLFVLRETDVWNTDIPLVYSRLIAPESTATALAVINETPGFNFAPGDEELLVGALALSMYFYWGFLCVSKDPVWWLCIDHDDVIRVCSPKPAGYEFDAEASFSPIGLMRLDPIK